MADTKTSALTALTGANVDATADVLPIVDTSVTTTKKILVQELALAMNVNGTEQATTSGTTKDFTIPAWATRVTVMLAGVSTNGTSGIIVQLGDGGGIETSNYLGANVTGGGTVTAFTSGFLMLAAAVAARIYEGVLELTLEDSTDFTWMGKGMLADQAGNTCSSCVGRKATSAAMTTVRLTTVSGDTFDAGSVNVLYS